MNEVHNLLTFDTWSGCDSGVVVRMVTVQGMRHTWPEEEDDGLDGTKLLLEFFKDKVKP